MRPDIVPGGTFPDCELPDHERAAGRLGELQGEDPMILTPARGGHCPEDFLPDAGRVVQNVLGFDDHAVAATGAR